MFHPQTTIHYTRLFLFCFCQSDEKINTLEIWVITYVKPESFYGLIIYSDTVQYIGNSTCSYLCFALFSFSIIVMYNVTLGPLHSSDLGVWAPGGESQCEVSTQGNLYTVSSL